MQEKYNIQRMGDHGMDGFVVQIKFYLDNKEQIKTFKMQHSGEVALTRRLLFKGESPVAIYDEYMKTAEKIYNTNWYQQTIGLVKDKPFWGLISLVIGSQIIHVEQYFGSIKHPFITRLQQIDNADSEDEYQERLKDFLDNSNGLDYESLWCVGLGDKAAKALSQYLVLQSQKRSGFFSYSAIGTLNLVENYITAKGCIDLARGIAVCPKMTFMSLSGNPIENTGLLSITKALSDHPSCHTLELDACSVTDECMTGIAALLSTNRVIKTIDLSRNTLTDKGVQMILDAVRSNLVIENIHLEATEVSNTMKDVLKKALSCEGKNDRISDNCSTFRV